MSVLKQKITSIFRRIGTRRQILNYTMIIFLSSYFFTRLFCLSCSENFSTRFMQNFLKMPDDISCYHKESHMDNLDQIKKNEIYLISASCGNSLSLHHACAIESIISTHISERQVYVFVTKPVKYCNCDESIIEGLKGIPNLHFVTIQIDKFVKDTPLKDIFTKEFLRTGVKRHDRVAEILKFAILYKYGGVVVDLDMILTKPVDFLGFNWAVKVNGSQLGSGILALSRKTHIGGNLLAETFVNLKLQRDSAKIDGGLALTEAFRKLCYDKKDVGCSNFRLIDAEFFYPYNRSSAYMLFEPGEIKERPYGFYVWDRTLVRRSRKSVYVKIMKEYCPNVAEY